VNALSIGVSAGAIVSNPAGSQKRKDDLSRYQETHVYNQANGICLCVGPGV
jgi:peptidase E